MRAAKWADWLEARFVTVDVTKAGAARSLPVAPISVQATRLPAVAAVDAKPRTRATRKIAGYVPRKLIRNDQS